MGYIRKGFSLLLIAILAFSSLMMVESAYAQSISKPSVPEFMLTVTDHSYDVPPSGHVNLNTGQFEKHAGFYMKNGSIEVSIKNQPFTSYTDSNGYEINLHYNIRAKGHGNSNWYYFPTENPEKYFHADYSTNTKRIFKYSMDNFEIRSGAFFDYSAFPSSGRVDFQVQAFVGHLNLTDEEFIRHLNETRNVPSTQAEDFTIGYVGQSSNWSNTQTATIPAYVYTSSSPTTVPTPSEFYSSGSSFSLPWSTLFGVVAVLLAIIVALSLLFFRKHQKMPGIWH
jgi:hypothetical protein